MNTYLVYGIIFVILLVLELAYFKIADKFRKFSNNIAVSAKESEIKASKEISNQNKKYKVSDVMDEMPDSASSALF